MSRHMGLTAITMASAFGVFTLATSNVSVFASPPHVEPDIEQGEPVRFDGHKVIRANIETQAMLDVVLALNLDIWSEHVGVGPVDIRVSPQELTRLNELGVMHEIFIDDVQALVDREQDELQDPAASWFDNYKSYEDVNAYLEDLVDLRPDIAELINVGESLRGRTVWGIRISGLNGPGDKPGILINGCQHAREWITVMTSMYTADRLIRDYDSDPMIHDLVDNMEFIIVPIVNPDGYRYTWTNNRMWRKNRRSNYGVDLNRNWGYHWGEGGSSGSTSSEIYRGEAPFSEPETQILRDLAITYGNIRYHMDIHSYSQMVLQPWGYTYDLPPDHDVIDMVGQDMVDAIFDTHGQTYVHGPIITTIYRVSGDISDWFYGERGIFSFSYELRDKGQYGFLLPADQIIPTSEEAFAGIVVLAESGLERRIFVDVLEPLAWNGTLHIRAARGVPFEDVYFYYSTVGWGETYIPELDVTIGLKRPHLLPVTTADERGIAELTMPIPNGTGDTLRIWFQAAIYHEITNRVRDHIYQ